MFESPGGEKSRTNNQEHPLVKCPKQSPKKDILHESPRGKKNGARGKDKWILNRGNVEQIVVIREGKKKEKNNAVVRLWEREGGGQKPEQRAVNRATRISGNCPGRSNKTGEQNSQPKQVQENSLGPSGEKVQELGRQTQHSHRKKWVMFRRRN